MATRAFLLIADIGGYTRFMKVHRINLAHAQHVVAQLLEAVIDGAGELKLAKLEGDAAFFYAPLKKASDVARYIPLAAEIRRAFLARREQMAMDRMCTCDSCVQAGELKIKFVAHEGEVAFQKVHRNNELAGVDVIYVHRLLKNDVPVSEYMLMSVPVHEHFAPTVGWEAHPIEHELEGLGHAKQYWFDFTTIGEDFPRPTPSTFFRRFKAWLKMTWYALPYFFGAKKACEGFRNMGANGILPPPVETTLSIGPPGFTERHQES